MEETHVGVWAVARSDNLSSVCGCREHCQGTAGDQGLLERWMQGEEMSKQMMTWSKMESITTQKTCRDT